MTPRRERWLVLAIVAAVAAYFVLFRAGLNGIAAHLGLAPPLGPPPWNTPRPGLLPDGRQPAYDVYAYFYPNMLYVLDALRDGGRGLFWNPLQNCGQAFFGLSGVLYPTNALFLALDADTAVQGAVILDLIVAGGFTYLLGRELGLGTAAALAGALAFELSNATVAMASWAPFMIAPYVWLPAAMLFTERLLRRPGLADAVGLGVALALALLPDYPQTVFLIYQLVGLRMLWGLVLGGLARPLASAAAIVLGLALGPLLAAVEFLPALEIARESVRNRALTLKEMHPRGLMDWGRWLVSFTLRSCASQPLILVPCMLAGAALLDWRRWRHVLFYLVAGAVTFMIALGPDTPLQAWYAQLPLGTAFRHPDKLTWLTSFCLAVLAALGVQAVVERAGADRTWLARALGPLLLLAVLFVFRAISPIGLLRTEWVLGGIAVAIATLHALTPIPRRWIGAGLCAALLGNLVLAPTKLWQYLLPDTTSLTAHAPLFERLRARMTSQDRAYLNFQNQSALGFGLMHKSGSLFGVPTLHDYEPQIARRYAEFFVVLRDGRPMPNVNFIIYAPGGLMPVGFNRRLLDLAGGRYLVTAAGLDAVTTRVRPPPHLIDGDADLRVYENPLALPRASFVSHIAVVPDPSLLLSRLAAARDDPRRTALVEGAPPSGFTGDATTGDGAAVEFAVDEPEHVVIRVQAPARGFLRLADQHFPGWYATVNGVPAPILRADYTFRLVEVPAGESVVDFRYAPVSVRLGAGISVVTVALVGILFVRGRRRA